MTAKSSIYDNWDISLQKSALVIAFEYFAHKHLHIVKPEYQGKFTEMHGNRLQSAV